MQKLENTKQGQPSGQDAPSDSLLVAADELKSAGVRQFAESLAALIIATVNASQPSVTTALAQSLRLISLHNLTHAAASHSATMTTLNANALSYAEVCMHKREQAVTLAYNNGQLSIERYCTLAHLNDKVDSKEYKDLVLEASTELQAHLCVIYEAMLCYATAIVIGVQHSHAIGWPKVTMEDYKPQRFDLDPDYKGWL